MTITHNCPPKSLNGYPVIAKHCLDDETWVIVAFRTDHSAHPYVVSLWSIHSPTSWVQGHYVEKFRAASDEFEALIARFS